MKLMLVDDHALFIEGLSYLLKTYGFEVACVANSGKDALEQAAVHQCRGSAVLIRSDC